MATVSISDIKPVKTRRSKVPFAEKLEALDKQIADTKDKLDDLETRRATMVREHRERARAMLDEVGAE